MISLAWLDFLLLNRCINLDVAAEDDAIRIPKAAKASLSGPSQLSKEDVISRHTFRFRMTNARELQFKHMKITPFSTCFMHSQALS